jgi:hypothetical protein
MTVQLPAVVLFAPGGLAVCLMACLAGCSSGKASSTDGPTCSLDVTDPALPGVSLHVEGDHCRVASGHAAKFRYELALSAPVSYEAEDSHGSCGRCAGYTEDPGTLVDSSFGDPGGGGIHYCECDTGCCLPTQPGPTLTLPAGTTAGELLWPGFQWNGPSDTGAQLGPAFPAGTYAFNVTFRVPGVGAVSASLPVEVY